jgi:hypothetical protein
MGACSVQDFHVAAGRLTVKLMMTSLWIYSLTYNPNHGRGLVVLKF